MLITCKIYCSINYANVQLVWLLCKLYANVTITACYVIEAMTRDRVFGVGIGRVNGMVFLGVFE
jgi:hypothetical protein